MLRLFAAIAITAITGIAAPLLAQRGQGEGFEGPRGAVTLDLSSGEPISFYLEISRELGLSEDQKTRLMNMRRRLRVQNGPYMKQLDSLRDLAGVELGERGRLTSDDREALERFRTWSRPVIDSIRVNNDLARREVQAMLDERQRATADSLYSGLLRRRPGTGTSGRTTPSGS